MNRTIYECGRDDCPGTSQPHRAALCPAIHTSLTVAERLFMGIFPTGIAYADRAREMDGDYLTLARLPFATLVLEWTGATCPDDLADAIRSDAEAMQARRGEEFQVSTAGQTVLLGDKPHE